MSRARKRKKRTSDPWHSYSQTGPDIVGMGHYAGRPSTTGWGVRDGSTTHSVPVASKENRVAVKTLQSTTHSVPVVYR